MSRLPHAPLLSSALAIATGIALGETFRYFPFLATAILVSALILSVLFRRRLAAPRQLLIMAGCLLLGILFQLDSLRLPQDHAAHLPEGDFALEGIVTSFPDGHDHRQSFIMEAKRAILKTGSRTVSGKVRIRMEATATPVHYGDRLRLSGRFYRIAGAHNPGGFDYESYLQREGIHLTGTVRSTDRVVLLSSNGNRLMRHIDGWRFAIREAAERSLSGPARGIFLAMTIGDERFVDDSMRDAFMASGATHILSISGSHVGFIAFLLYNIIRLSFRLFPAPFLLRATLFVNPSRAAALATMPVVVFYTLLAGAQVATVRSTVMVVTYLAAILIGRGSQPLNSLALAAILTLLFDPQAIFSISFQLSFLSVLLICLAVERREEATLLDRLGQKDWRGNLKKRLSAYLRMTIAASLGTLPLVAFYFNSVPWTGMVANTIIIPLAGLVVVPLALSSSIWGMTSGVLPLASWNQAAIDLFYRAVTLFAAIPGAEAHCPSPSSFLLIIFYALLLLWYAGRRRALLAGAALPCIIFIIPLILPAHNEGMAVDFIDIGQGDCTLVRLPDSKTMLVDGGGSFNDRFDPGRRTVAPFLWDQGIRRLDFVVLSHNHPDHIGGLRYILRNFTVGEVWESGTAEVNEVYREIRAITRERDIPVRQLRRGDSMAAGTARIDILHPVAGFAAGSPRGEFSDENSSSLVMKITTPEMTLLLPGDVEEEAESVMSRLDLRADVIKVPHHGGRTSSSRPFLNAVRPSVAVISVGRHNSFGHPMPEALAGYRAVGARIYRTDRDGAVSLTTGGAAKNQIITVITCRDRSLRHVQWKEGLTGTLQTEGNNLQKLWNKPWVWEGKGFSFERARMRALIPA